MSNKQKEVKDNTSASSKRAEAAKDLGSTQIQGMKDSAKAVINTAKGFITGGPVGAVKAAVPAIGTVAKDAFNLYKNLFKVIFNDASMYGGNIPLPINEIRPMGMINYQGIARHSTMGFIPKLSELHISMFEFSDSNRFNDNIDALYQDMKLALRSNLTYSIDDVKRFVLNNISLYILAKYYEKRLGFTKYEDPQFAEFRELWKTNELGSPTYNIYRALSKNSDFSADENLAHTLDIYEEMCESAFRFVLPVNMKKWVDHYIGSLFILDDDVMNPKYISIVPQEVPYYNGENVEYISVNGLTIAQLNDVINTFRHTAVFNNIRADIVKIPTLANERAISFEFAIGALTPYDQYVPTPVVDVTFKQALINAYTDKKAVYNGFVRIDLLPNNDGDNLTTLLFMGATYNDARQASVFKVKGISVTHLVSKVFASPTNNVSLTPGMVQSGSNVFEEPFAIAITSSVSSDVYVNASTTEEGRIYYPNGLTYAVGTRLNCYLSSDPYKFRWWEISFIGSNAKVAIPVLRNSSGYIICLVSRESYGEVFDHRFVNATDWEVKALPPENVNRSNHLKLAVDNRQPVLINEYDESLFLGETPLTRVGLTGYAQISRYYSELFIDMHYSVDLYADSGESPTELEWYTDILFPNSDLSNMYIIGQVPANSLAVHSGYIMTSQWLFTALGYCIPVLNSLKIHTNIDEDSNVFEYSLSMLKEDYIPTTINVEDVPPVMSKMIDGLTKFHK